MIDVCFDTLSNSLDLTNLREMFREMEESPNIFINLLMDKFRKEIEEQEERLLSQGYCPKCENEIGYSDAYEWHEVWGQGNYAVSPEREVVIIADGRRLIN